MFVALSSESDDSRPASRPLDESACRVAGGRRPTLASSALSGLGFLTGVAGYIAPAVVIDCSKECAANPDFEIASFRPPNICRMEWHPSV